jgi:4-amino-4-deoxy-L-arabinose transferase-like glycosyltransferase
MFLGVIGIELLFLTASLIKNPIITDWDGWAIWGLKAKAFFTNQGFHQYLSRASDLGFSWPARPCLSSIFQAYVYLLCGQVNELAGRIAHLAISISLLLLFYFTLRRRLTAQAAMVWTAMLSTIPNLVYIASAGLGNLPLALFLFSAVSALDRWKSDGNRWYFAASSAFLGFALLSRDEALGLCAICAASILLLSPRLNPTPLLRKIFQTVLLLAGAFAIYSLWSRIVRPYNIFDLRSIWLSQELLLRVQSHLPDLTAVLKSILDELTKPSEQSLASPLEKHWGVSFFWVIFAWTFVFSGIRAMFRRHFRGILHQQSSLEISCGICTLLGLMAYSAGLCILEQCP